MPYILSDAKPESEAGPNVMANDGPARRQVTLEPFGPLYHNQSWIGSLQFSLITWMMSAILEL